MVCTAALVTPGAASSVTTSAPSFAGPRSYATGKIPVSVAIADLNADGKPDVAVANEGGESESVSVLLNRGDGRLQPRRDYATGLEPSSVVIGDLNGDGKLDLATTNYDLGTVRVLLGDGLGNLQTSQIADPYPNGATGYHTVTYSVSGKGGQAPAQDEATLGVQTATRKLIRWRGLSDPDNQ